MLCVYLRATNLDNISCYISDIRRLFYLTGCNSENIDQLYDAVFIATGGGGGSQQTHMFKILYTLRTVVYCNCRVYKACKYYNMGQ